MKVIIHYTIKLVGSISMNWQGTFFTSAKALHFVIEATLHWKGICIYSYDAFGMPFIITFNKAAGCPFPT